MRHILKYLSLYERLCSGAMIICALLLAGEFTNLSEQATSWLVVLPFVILLLAVIAKLWLHDVGTKAIRRGVEVG